MDRYVPPFWGRRRGWAALAQVALFALTLALAGVGHRPETPLGRRRAGARHRLRLGDPGHRDRRLRRRGAAARGAGGGGGGAHRGLPRRHVRGGRHRRSRSPANGPGRRSTSASPASTCRCCSSPGRRPSPRRRSAAPRTLREAVWYPFLGFLARHRALEILAFVILYKFADNLAQSLQRPFLVDMGYSDFDRGFALATVGLFATLIGTFFGGRADQRARPRPLAVDLRPAADLLEPRLRAGGARRRSRSAGSCTRRSASRH